MWCEFKQGYHYLTYSLSFALLRCMAGAGRAYKKLFKGHLPSFGILRPAGYNPFIIADFMRFNMGYPMRMLQNIHYVRYVECALAVEKLAPSRNLRLLDVGSGSSLLPLFLLSKGCEVYITDIDEYVFCQTTLSRNNRYVTPEELRRLKIEIADIRRTNYPDEFFDRVVLLSTVEHLMDDDDSAAMREVRRILKKGGIAFLTFDVAKDAHELVYQVPGYVGFRMEDIERIKENVRHNPSRHLQIDFTVLKKGFSPGYTRFYNERTMMERLVKPSGLKLIEHGYCGDHMFLLRALFDRKAVVEYLYWLQPLLALILYRKYSSDSSLRDKPGAIGYCVLSKEE